MTTTRDAFEAWLNEQHPLDTTGTRRDYMPKHDGGFIWLAWQAATLAEKRQPLTCVWTEQDDESMPGTYASACGEMWSFTDGGVADNNVRFCQGCGKSVEVHGIKA